MIPEAGDYPDDADTKGAMVLRGAAAILEALGVQGVEGKKDADFAKPIVEAELEVRALVDFALAHMITPTD